MDSSGAHNGCFVSVAKISNPYDECEAFVVTYSPKRNSLFVIERYCGLIEYSQKSNSWIKHKIKSSIGHYVQSCNYPVAIDCDQNMIYFCSENGVYNQHKFLKKLQINDSNACKLEEIENVENNIDQYHSLRGTKGVMMNNEFHVIGNGKHIKYDTVSKQFKLLHKTQYIVGHGLVKIKNNKLLMFGGKPRGGDPHRDTLDSVHEYDINAQKWSTLNCKIPKPLHRFGCVPILNDEYIILIGGNWTDDIYIYSVRNKTFSKSSVKCPKNTNYEAIATMDRNRDEIITFGYVRFIWMQYFNDNNVLYPPKYLIKIICGYYMNQDVHIFATGYFGTEVKVITIKLMHLSFSNKINTNIIIPFDIINC